MHKLLHPLGATNTAPKFDAKASAKHRVGSLAAVVNDCLRHTSAQKPAGLDLLPENFGALQFDGVVSDWQPQVLVASCA
jgi:hypothetical protein